ncbi:MAG TPA: DUF1876 domain-containing protein [Acidimicrobiia bacterium]|nr:DUF1876 domain-containing protein [Acidimicrobiia bacterium]
MGETREFSMDVVVDEDAERTEAKVLLRLGQREFAAWGRARRNPEDPNVPVIGEELALARAMNEMAHRLVEAAADAIESFEGRPVDIHV